ncbi:MAG TPA: histidine kinase [Bacteroidales bacterium]|nr:histidine kinase [Bacteroidales bacterium]
MKLSDKDLIDELKRRFDENSQALTELKEMASELQRVNKKLTESEKLKSNFISNINNEIVNPFASIVGLAHSLAHLKEGNWEKVKVMAKLIHAEAFSLDFQLKNVFKAAEIEAGEAAPAYSIVNIPEIIDRISEDFKLEALAKEIEIITDVCNEIDFFKTDVDKLSIILNNLISNAIKYSFKKGKIDLKVCLQNSNLEITVTDYGKGISPNNRDLIFDRFERFDSGINTPNRGHGLGLSVTKALIDLLDGHISFETEINKGTKFKVIIPNPGDWVKIDGFTGNPDELFFNQPDIF